MARVRVSWNRGGAYDGELGRVRLVRDGVMREAGEYLAVQIENRALGGRDEAGNRFVPYTAAYAKAKNVSTTAVDLRRSGEMFAALGTLSHSRTHVRVGFRSAEMSDRARYNEKRRRFMGIDKRWLQDVRRRIVAGIGFYR